MYTCTCILHSHGMLIKDKEELKIDHLRIVSECSGLYKAFSLNSMLSISALILPMNRAVVGVWWGRMAALWLILVCCVFRVFVWKMCLKEPHIGSLKDLEAFRISKDVSLIGIGLPMHVNEDLFFSKQRLQEVHRDVWPCLHFKMIKMNLN